MVHTTWPLNVKTIKIQETRATRATGNKTAFTSAPSHLEHVLHNSIDLLFRTEYANPGLTRFDVQDNAIMLARTIEPEKKNLFFLPVQRRAPTLAPPSSVPKRSSYDKLRVMKRQTTRKKTKHFFTSSVQTVMLKLIEKAFSDAFFNGFIFAIDGLKATLFHFVKRVLMKMAKNGAPDKLFDCNIDRWTHLPMFIDAFAKYLAASSSLSTLWRNLPVISWRNSPTSSIKRYIHENIHSLFQKLLRSNFNFGMKSCVALVSGTEIWGGSYTRR